MSGRNQQAASTTGRRSRLNEQVGIRCPAGSRAAIERAAAEAGMVPADYLRRMLRRDLEAARKRRERKASR